MLDRPMIYARYALCFNANSSGELARILGIARQTTNDWKNGKSKVPWWRLKELVDTKGIRWDWLLCGLGEQHHSDGPRCKAESFDIAGINNRFLELFPESKIQADLARRLNVSQVTVHKWHRAQEQVSWQKLENAINEFNVTWEWIIEGR